MSLHSSKKSCSDRENADNLDSFSLAMSYVPWQEWEDLYKPEDGFSQGTIFKQLNKPFTGRRWGK